MKMYIMRDFDGVVEGFIEYSCEILGGMQYSYFRQEYGDGKKRFVYLNLPDNIKAKINKNDPHKYTHYGSMHDAKTMYKYAKAIYEMQNMYIATANLIKLSVKKDKDGFRVATTDKDGTKVYLVTKNKMTLL